VELRWEGFQYIIEDIMKARRFVLIERFKTFIISGSIRAVTCEQ
jgi:hypothetical protein